MDAPIRNITKNINQLDAAIAQIEQDIATTEKRLAERKAYLDETRRTLGEWVDALALLRNESEPKPVFNSSIRSVEAWEWEVVDANEDVVDHGMAPMREMAEESVKISLEERAR